MKHDLQSSEKSNLSQFPKIFATLDFAWSLQSLLGLLLVFLCLHSLFKTYVFTMYYELLFHDSLRVGKVATFNYIINELSFSDQLFTQSLSLINELLF